MCNIECKVGRKRQRRLGGRHETKKGEIAQPLRGGVGDRTSRGNDKARIVGRNAKDEAARSEREMRAAEGMKSPSHGSSRTHTSRRRAARYRVLYGRRGGQEAPLDGCRRGRPLPSPDAPQSIVPRRAREEMRQARGILFLCAPGSMTAGGRRPGRGELAMSSFIELNGRRFAFYSAARLRRCASSTIRRRDHHTLAAAVP